MNSKTSQNIFNIVAISSFMLVVIMFKVIDRRMPSIEVEISTKACIYELQERITALEKRMKIIEDYLLDSSEYYNKQIMDGKIKR